MSKNAFYSYKMSSVQHIYDIDFAPNTCSSGYVLFILLGFKWAINRLRTTSESPQVGMNHARMKVMYGADFIPRDQC